MRWDQSRVGHQGAAELQGLETVQSPEVFQAGVGDREAPKPQHAKLAHPFEVRQARVGHLRPREAERMERQPGQIAPVPDRRLACPRGRATPAA